jgi:hypothetical protein
MKHLILSLLLLSSIMLLRGHSHCYAESLPPFKGKFPITVMPNSLMLNASDSAFIYVPEVNDSIIQCYVTKYSELEFLIIYRYPSKDCIYTMYEGFIADVIVIGRNFHVKLEDN